MTSRTPGPLILRMILNILAPSMTVLPLLLALGAPPAEATRVRVLMGTTCSAQVRAADEASAEAAATAALDEIERLEGVLSTWRDDAELARANVAARTGEAPLSPELARALDAALLHARRTRGAFDPSVGALEDAWDLRGAGRVPTRAELRSAREATGFDRVRLDAAARTLRFDRPSTWLDSGGFGKGLALDAAARVLRERGVSSALVDFGGQVLAMGEAATVGVADPRDRARPALEIALRDASASTSAQSERFVTVGARRFGHVVDPRTGRPVSFRGSATVVGPDAFEADVMSTALLVMGPREGLELARAEGLCAGFLVPRGSRLLLRATPSFLALVTRREGVAEVSP